MWNKLIMILVTLFILVGCATSLEKKVKIINHEVKKTPLNIPSLSPLHIENVKWYVVEYDGKWYIAYVVEDYETISSNMEKLQNYILEQNLIINQYKQYYETESNEPKLKHGN